MNSKEDYTEHTIHGHVPQDEWHKFFKQHFAPTKPGAQTQAAARAASGSASDICASLGCPTTLVAKTSTIAAWMSRQTDQRQFTVSTK